MSPESRRALTSTVNVAVKAREGREAFMKVCYATHWNISRGPWSRKGGKFNAMPIICLGDWSHTVRFSGTTLMLAAPSLYHPNLHGVCAMVALSSDNTVFESLDKALYAVSCCIQELEVGVWFEATWEPPRLTGWHRPSNRRFKEFAAMRQTHEEYGENRFCGQSP